MKTKFDSMLIHIYRSDGELQCTQSTDNSTQLMLLSSAIKPSQDSEPHQGPEICKAAKAEPVFPPSFTQLMNSCRPAVSEGRLPSSIVPFDASLVDYLGAATKTEPGNLKTQFVVKPLSLSSFHIIVDTDYFFIVH